MFYGNLAGISGQNLTGTQTSLLGGQTLTGIQPLYWSVTDFGPFAAWRFGFDSGSQGVVGVSNLLSAWAVRPGDVLLAPVPEPETYAMMLAGLGLMGFVAKRRKQKAS